MKFWVVKEKWEFDNSSESGDMYLFLTKERAMEKFFEVRERIQKEFTEWYGEKDEGEYKDGNWTNIDNWNITEDSNLVFTCANNDYEFESVELFSQETID